LFFIFFPFVLVTQEITLRDFSRSSRSIGDTKSSRTIMSDIDLADLFGDDSGPRKPAPQRGRRPAKRPARVPARQVDVWDFGDDDNIDDGGGLSDVVASLHSRIVFYFDCSARLLVDELRTELDCLLDPFRDSPSLIQCTIDEISEAVKRELSVFKRLRLKRERLQGDAFGGFESAFAKLFWDAAQYANPPDVPVLRRYATEALELARVVESGLGPFVASLHAEIGDVMQRGRASGQDGGLRRRMWELEGRAREQEMMGTALKAQLSFVSELRDGMERPLFEDVTKSAVAELIDGLRQEVEKRNRKVAIECRSRVTEMRGQRIGIARMRSDLLESSFPVLPITMQPTGSIAEVKDRKGSNLRFSQLHTILDSMQKEQRQDLENATMFLEALRAEENAHQKSMMGRLHKTLGSPVQQPWTV
jgi:hypothetical protein